MRGYVLVATSPNREARQLEDRLAFLRHCEQIANGRPLIFKLHPLEKVERARREIVKVVPDALILTHGNVNHMIANAEEVITQKSTCTFVALALEKQVHTQLDPKELRHLLPLQNQGDSARRIAVLCRRILHTPMPVLDALRLAYRSRYRSSAWSKPLPKGRWEIPSP
jgi:hypothetical protein